MSRRCERIFRTNDKLDSDPSFSTCVFDGENRTKVFNKINNINNNRPPKG